MSANQSDDALQRLNYFNGQRLAAGDFRAEQDYHMAMRRVLNRSLYSPGIVVGLEVEPDKADKHRVIVRHGLAFDHLGREIFIPVDVSVQVMGVPSSMPGVVFGNLLVVSYREMRKHPAQMNCMVGAPYKPCSGDLAWGAPTRIVADAMFEFADSWPSADSGKVVLSQIELSKSCEVVRTLPGVRKYAMPAKAGRTRALALVGEDDIAPGVAKLLRFHIADGFPDRVILYLKGGVFTPFWYSEIAKHTHTPRVRVKDNQLVVNINHTHTIEGQMSKDGGHKHSYWKADKDESGGIDHTNTPIGHHDTRLEKEDDPDNPFVVSGAHQHDLSNIKVSAPNPTSFTLVPDFSPSTIDDTGHGAGMRVGAAYDYFKEMAVKLDGVDVTAQILAQMPTFAQLGVGNSATPANEAFVKDGTPAIDLSILGIDLLPGAHTLEFSVPPGKGGGKLYYNLYID
ncbi:MAG: hypothetical protein ACJ8NR_11125 [Sulfurifustis sp.]